ncbi:unnamed protein product [Gongylonema pulchrum]|uniref:Focal_AT domain-containing protein n=1 Tax=Gongylonema pulchrum TaxID=637853 RepID=A0A183D2E2_9BILA|nr:unnamed protein product [Gongylonema pulchrum]
MESSYDTPRPGRTFRSRAEDAAAVNQDHYQHHLSFGVPSGTGAIAQRAQLGQIREPGRLMMPTLEEKAEPSSSTSVLQNVFNGLSGSSSSTNSAPLVASASSSTINDDEETKFNHSFSSDNGRGFGTRNFTVPKQATAYASNKYSSDNSFRYGGSVAPELSTRYRSLESGVCSLVGDENTTTRKQTICSKLTEKYRLIDIAVKKLDECTAAHAWRQPHILQRHIPDIKENVETIASAMTGFLDAACRIAVDSGNPKATGKQRCTFMPIHSSVRDSHGKESDHSGRLQKGYMRVCDAYG